MSERGTRLYFAYGSNLHPLRLGLRTPACEPLGTARLDGYRLCFHKRSDGDGSAKADAWRSGAADDVVHGVVYRMHEDEIPVLDEIEGLGAGGYELRTESVRLGGEPVRVFLYAALASHIDTAMRPYTWYRDLVWRGAAWQGFPATYVDAIRAVPAVADANAGRHADNERLLSVMPDWQTGHGYRLP